MSRQALRRWIARKTFKPPRPEDRPLDCLWSKGIARFCDVRGDATYWLAGTEMVQDEAFFARHYAGASGLVWVRLGTGARRGKASDLDHFVRAALPTIRSPFLLVTTDGDLSVPSEVAPETVSALLASPYLVAWATQNCDGGCDARIRPFPIGLDLHSRRPFTSPAGLLDLLNGLAARRVPVDRQELRVFCDLGLNIQSDDRRQAMAALADCPHVEMQRRRTSQEGIWKRYAEFPFVLSAIGGGLDCHRTWEALMLGSIVITRTSVLDPLFAELPIVIVEDWREVRDPANLERWRHRHAAMTRPDYLGRRLRPAHYLEPLRALLRSDSVRAGLETTMAGEDPAIALSV